MSDPGEEQVGPLPVKLRARMITLASQGLSRMPADQVPPSLRRAASFAPSRRAKLAGSQIEAAVESDEEFRGHLAVQVKGMVPGTLSAPETGNALGGQLLVDAAAVAYIARDDGWAELVKAAARAEQHAETGATGELVEAVERLKGQLDAARRETGRVREKLKAQVDDLKRENRSLRHTLAEARHELTDASSKATRAAEGLDEVQRQAEVAARASEAEARRLRARVAELESDTSSARRAARDERDLEAMRLRLLLDTLVDATHGLRRELGLPPSELLPADTVESVEAPTPRIGGVGRAMLSDDPGLLRRLLELPRVHLIVDGYNVSKTAWHAAPLDQQRAKLVAGVTGLVAGKGIETTIVFDGADLVHPPPMPPSHTVRVRFSPPGVIADDLIRQLVSAEPTGRPVVVVSTDREVAESVTKMGARAVASLALAGALGA
ncbi:MAG: NYN domain-containing protein [Nocardioidaceae bacterium]